MKFEEIDQLVGYNQGLAEILFVKPTKLVKNPVSDFFLNMVI
jgi:hypothetical protein